MEPLSASTRRSLEIFKHASAVIALLLSILSIYLIRNHSARATSTTYKALLMGVVVTAQIHDFYLGVLFDPVVLSPLPCLYTEGLLYHKLIVEAKDAVTAWNQVMNVMTCPAGWCFIYRNQAILQAGDRFKFPKWTAVPVIAFFCLLYVLEWPISQNFTGDWPSDVGERIACCDPLRMDRALAYLITIAFIVASTLAVFCSHTFYTLRRMKMISEKSRQFHREATWALLMQATIPAAMMILPIFAVLLHAGLRIESREFIHMMLSLMGLHSIVHSITLILSTKSIRATVMRKSTNSNSKDNRIAQIGPTKGTPS